MCREVKLRDEFLLKSGGGVIGESRGGMGGARQETGGKTGAGTPLLEWETEDDLSSVMMGGKTRSDALE